MNSKIDGVGQRPPAVGGGSRSSGTERSAGKSDSPDAPRGSDRVTLTDSARQLQRLAEAVANAPDTDSVRVASLRDAVARGEYKPDSERVASRLVSLERDLVGR
jgi:negative regulator of flagellin synthesis FlgM